MMPNQAPGWHPPGPMQPQQFDARDLVIAQLHGQVMQLSMQISSLTASLTMTSQQMATRAQALANARALLSDQTQAPEIRVANALAAMPLG